MRIVLIIALCMIAVGCGAKKTLKHNDTYEQERPRPSQTPGQIDTAPAPRENETAKALLDNTPQQATLYFAFDSDKMQPGEALKLDHLDLPGRCVTVTGHACQIGADAYNMDLSTRRAYTVYEYLCNVLHAADVTWRGMGEKEPVEFDKEKYWLNRRVIVYVEPRRVM